MKLASSTFNVLDVPKSAYLYLVNTKRIYQFKSKLEADLTQEEIVLVYQMGKVGSTSIEKSLIHITDVPFYRCHYLNPSTVNRLLSQKIRIFKSSIKTHYLTSKYLSAKLTTQGLGRSNWKLITIVREPIATNISRFFESIQDFIPDFYRKYGNLTNFYQEIDNNIIDLQEIIEYFWLYFPYHDWNLNWFDQEMKPVFDIDIFSHNFSYEKGYQILKKGNINLLVLKLENLDEKVKEAFKDFMEIEKFSLKKSNVAKNKIYSNAYEKFKKFIVLPEEYVNQQYQHKYTKHFYSEKEREILRSKWLSR